MQHNYRSGRDWPIAIAHSPDLFIVEITDKPDQRSVFLSLFEAMYDQSGRISVSQYEDPRQWDVAPAAELALHLAAKFGVDCIATQTLESSEEPQSPKRPFFLHVLGEPRMEWMQEVLRFGGASLANVTYGVAQDADSWRKHVMGWNDVMLGWFHLRLGTLDQAVLELVTRRQPLSMTIDGHLVWHFTESRWLDRLLRVLEQQAHQKDLDLCLISEDILAPKSRWSGRRMQNEKSALSGEK